MKGRERKEQTEKEIEKENEREKSGILERETPCDAPFLGGPLTTRQPAEYSWISGNPTPLTKIGQSPLYRELYPNTSCPKQFIMTTSGPHASKIMAT